VFLGAAVFVTWASEALGGGNRSRCILVGLFSLTFYAYWDYRFVGLILGSIAVNYYLGTALSVRPSRLLLALGVAANLALIALFKYADFLMGTAATIGNAQIEPWMLTLPLGISFYTFEQIAFLVTIYRNPGAMKPISGHDYVLFVTFFPHLIAGP